MAAVSPVEVTDDAESIEKVKKRVRCPFGIKTFTFTVFILLITVRIGQMYLNGSIRMLEKQFGFTSAQTGFIAATDNISAIPMVLVIGYLGDRLNKARILAVCGILTALANFMACLPYLTTLDNNYKVLFNDSNSTEEDILCGAAHSKCVISTESLDAYNRNAFVIIVISRLVHGVGGVSISNLGIAYISSNAKTGSKGKLMSWLFFI